MIFFEINKNLGLIPKYNQYDIVINGLNSSNYKRQIDQSNEDLGDWVYKNVKSLPIEVEIALNIEKYNFYYFLFDKNEGIFTLSLSELEQFVDDDYVIKNITSTLFPNVLSDICDYKSNFDRRAVYSLNQYFKHEDHNILYHSIAPRIMLNDLINVVLRKNMNVIRSRGMLINKLSAKKKTPGIQQEPSFHYFKSKNFQFKQISLPITVSKKLSIDVPLKQSLVIALDKRSKMIYDRSLLLSEIQKTIKFRSSVVFIHPSKNSFESLNFEKHFLYKNLTLLEGFVFDLYQYIQIEKVYQLLHKNE